MVGCQGSPIDVFFGRDTIDIVGSCLKIIRFRIYNFFSRLKILMIQIFFIWSRILVTKRTLSKTKRGNKLFIVYQRKIHTLCLKAGSTISHKPDYDLVGPRKDKLHGLRKLTNCSSSQLPENSKDTWNEWKASVDIGVALHFCCDWGMQSHFRYVWTKLTCTSLPSLIHIVKACFRKVVQL